MHRLKISCELQLTRTLSLFSKFFSKIGIENFIQEYHISNKF
jgi:hypothetical protein